MLSSPHIAPYIAVLLKRKILFVVSAFVIMTLGTFITYVIPNKYEASCVVFIEKSVISELVKGLAITPSIDDSIKVLTTALTSRTLIHKVIGEVDFNQKAHSDAEIEKLITELQKNTEVRLTNKELFRVTFKYGDPRIARDYVNTLVRLYVEGETSSNRNESYDASNFLTEQINAHKKKMEEIEAEVSRYKSSQTAAASFDAGQVFREINNEQQRLFELQLRRKQLQEEKSYVKSASDPSRQKLTALVKKLDELRSQYTESYPEIVNIKSQIETLQEELKLQKIPNSQVTVSPDIWKLDAELKAIQENEATIQRHLAENRALLASIPSAKIALEKLEAAKETQKTMHDLLAMRSNQAEMSKQMGIQDKGTNYRIVDPAVTPVVPVSPNRKKLLLLSVLAGFAGATGILMLLEQFDQSVKLVDTLRPLGLPVLAVIPLIKSKEEVLAEKRRDFKLLAASGGYFLLIMAVLVMELLGIGLFESVVRKLHLPQLFAPFLK